MPGTTVPITPEGFKKLKKELKYLKEVERPQNVRDIEEAREHGDLSENAEYHAAKEKQGLIEARMNEIEDKISRAEVIDPAKIKSDRISFGARVSLENLDTGEEVQYRIVGADEADLDRGTISIESPLARALIRREPGDEVKVRTPGGMREFEIIDFDY